MWQKPRLDALPAVLHTEDSLFPFLERAVRRGSFTCFIPHVLQWLYIAADSRIGLTPFEMAEPNIRRIE
jgi:hypothetical protein